MKHSILAIAIVFSIAGSASALAEEQATPENPAEPAATVVEAPSAESPGAPSVMPGAEKPCKGKGGMMHGGGQHGKGQEGMMHGAGRHGKGSEQNDRQLAQRLDMIEARMAKIEAMLEILVRR
jgi:hypothetical protein